MFEEFGPANPPLPPTGALEQAMNRGRRIRRQRRAGIASSVALSAALIGGLVFINPLHSTKAFVPPAIKPTTAPRDYSPIPLSPSETPAIAKELDFGILNKVTTKNGIITLHVDRATFTLNDSIAGWDIKDTDGPKDLTFVLDPKASIQAEGGLQDDQASTDERVTLTLTQFLRNIDTMTVHYQKNSTEPAYPMVWLRHTDGPNGPVTALADQYTP